MPATAMSLALCLAGPVLAEPQTAPLPFEGRWDCGIGIFDISATRYDPGDGPMEIVDIAADGAVYTLTFEDDYQLSLGMNDDGTMSWFSPVSGDSFTCRRAG